MSILAIDTATQVSSVAVLKDGKIAAELTLQGRLTHSETLMPHIEQVMQMANVTREGLTGIAVSIGPGSFTGLRIGLAAAKAMAYALNVQLVGVSTLKALACQIPAPGVRLVALLDAQKGNAYVESYHFVGTELVTLHEVTVEKITDVIERAQDINEPVILLGDAVQKKIAGKIDLPEGVTIAPPQSLMPRAACVAVLGAQELARGNTANVMNLEPIYIRRSEAEVLWEQRHPDEAAKTKPTEEM